MDCRSAFERWLDQLWQFFAQILCPPIVVCCLVVTGVSKVSLECIEPFIKFLGHQIFLLEFLFLVLWGLWIVHIGLPLLGWSFTLFAVLPSWPFALYDVVNRTGCRRFLLAFVGLRHLQSYEGAAASPEIGLLATVLAKVPMMTVIAVACAEGRDVLVIGGKENDFLRFIVLCYLLISGVSISHAAYVCVDAVRPWVRRGGIERVEAVIGQKIDGVISRIYIALVHAIDAVTITSVVGSVGGKYDPQFFMAWLVALWFTCGLLPACMAPPPMPTLKPSIPRRGAKAFFHKMSVSILLTAAPPSEYLPLLPRSTQVVWVVATVERSIWLAASTLSTHGIAETTIGSLDTYLCIIGCISTAMLAIIRYISYEESPHTRYSIRRPDDLSIAHTSLTASLLRAPSQQFSELENDSEVGKASVSSMQPVEAADTVDGARASESSHLGSISEVRLSCVSEASRVSKVETAAATPAEPMADSVATTQASLEGVVRNSIATDAGGPEPAALAKCERLSSCSVTSSPVGDDASPGARLAMTTPKLVQQLPSLTRGTWNAHEINVPPPAFDSARNSTVAPTASSRVSAEPAPPLPLFACCRAGPPPPQLEPPRFAWFWECAAPNTAMWDQQEDDIRRT